MGSDPGSSGGGSAQDVTAAVLALFVLPLCALVYCTHAKATDSAGRTVNDSAKSGKSGKGSKSVVGSTAAKPPASPPGNAPAPTGGGDNRAAWAAKFLENPQARKAMYEEFNAHLRDYAAPGRTKVRFEANHSKNRYGDMAAYDQDRVILKGPSDYINANYMAAPDGTRYIATQGPLLDTRCDFWQMVVQEEALIVLQLCKFVEGDVEKCAEYWPATADKDTVVLDRFTIRRIEKAEEIAPGTTRTKLRIESKTVNRTVQHIFCDCWPDQLAPADPAAIIKIWNYIKTNRSSGPVVVHCSAGVGRTATFIGLSYGVEMLKRDGATMADVVRELRKCRPRAVQTHIQYGFLHAALLELFIQMGVVPRNQAAEDFQRAFRASVDKQKDKRDKTDKSVKQPAAAAASSDDLKSK